MTSLILGLLSFCLPVLSILAILFGVLGLVEIKRSQGRVRGTARAIAGIATGFGSLVVLALLVLFVRGLRESAARNESINHLKQIGLALYSFNDALRSLPPQSTYDKNGRPLLSWRVYLLPYMEEDNLFRQFKLDEPWDSPNNSRLLTLMPPVYTDSLVDPEVAKRGLTHYQVFVVAPGSTQEPALGSDNGPLQPFLGGTHVTVFRKSTGAMPRDFPNGLSKIIGVAQATDPVPWTKPQDLSYSPQQPLPRLGIAEGFFLAGLMDGTVRIIDTRSVSEKTIRAAILRNSNEKVGPDW